MGTDLHATIVIVAITAGVGAELTFLPDGQLHRHIRQHKRFASAPAQPAAQVEAAFVARQFKIIVCIAIPDVSRIMPLHTDDAVEGNSLIGVEQMIEIGGKTAAMSAERFALEIFSAADF